VALYRGQSVLSRSSQFTVLMTICLLSAVCCLLSAVMLSAVSMASCRLFATSSQKSRRSWRLAVHLLTSVWSCIGAVRLPLDQLQVTVQDFEIDSYVDSVSEIDS
jgi:hypothetical protein